MSDATARLALPFIAPGQAQKELFHNEALARIDALTQAAVIAVGLDQPPDAPEPGQCWIVGKTPSGGWAGQGGALAVWTDGGWRFAAAFEGMSVWSLADGLAVRFDGQDWRTGEVMARRLVVGGRAVVGMQQSAIISPTGGTSVDAEARATISAILAALRSHGLIAY